MELERAVNELTQRVETLEEENKELKKRQDEVEGKFGKTRDVMILALKGSTQLKRAVEKAMKLIRKQKGA